MLERIAHGWSDWHPGRLYTGLCKMKDLTERSSNPLPPASWKCTSDLLTPLKLTAASGTEFRSLSVTLKAPKTWFLSTLTPPHTPRREQGQAHPLGAQLTERTVQPDRVSRA